MTIDVLAAAQADRQSKPDVIERAKALRDARRAELKEWERLFAEAPAKMKAAQQSLNTLEVFFSVVNQIEAASDIFDDKLADMAAPKVPESTTHEPSNSGASEADTGDLRTTPSEPEIPTIPPPQEGEEAVTVPEIDLAPVKTERTKYQLVLDAVRKHPQANSRAIAKVAGVPIGTSSAYLYRAREEYARELAEKAAPDTQDRREPNPESEAPAEGKPTPAPHKTPARSIAIPPLSRAGSNTKFRLRNADGQYLHSDLNVMLKKGLRFVGRRDYPWEGTERQLMAVRKMLPATADLREEVIEP